MECDFTDLNRYEEDIDKLKAEINRKVEEVLERPKRFLRNLKEIITKYNSDRSINKPMIVGYSANITTTISDKLK